LKYIVTLLILAFIAGCRETAEKKGDTSIPEVTINESVKKLIGGAKDLNSIFEVNNIIQLETTKESLLGTIEALIYRPDEDRIIILDNDRAKGIFVFNTKGKFLNRIGKEGPGPGEYKSLKTIAYDNGILAVYSMPFKLLFYKLDGTFIKEIELIKRKWFFAADKMLLFKNDLYIYTNNDEYCTGLDGKKHRVFKIKGIDQYETAYGEPEETYSISNGDIALYNQRVIFTSVLDGNIYQILPGGYSISQLLSLGPLCDLSGIKEAKDKIFYLIKNMKEMDSFIQVGEIEKLLFIQRHRQIMVTDNTGNVLNKSIRNDLDLPPNYEGYYMTRLGILFDKNGLIFPSKQINNGNINEALNPALIFYRIKKQ
jgi:hypothetical protein